MTEKFNFALHKVLEAEGGFVDHKADRGGVTNYGITKATYTHFLGRAATDDDMKDMTVERAKEVYYALYWNPLNLEQVRDWRLACILFDQAVNRGPRVAVKKLQETLNKKIKGSDVTEDGILGPRTIHLINRTDPRELALWYVCTAQLDYARIVEFNQSQIVFLRGWLRRTHLLLELIFKPEGNNDTGETNGHNF